MKYRLLKYAMVFAITIGSTLTCGALPPPPPPAFFDEPAAGPQASASSENPISPEVEGATQESGWPSDNRAADYPDRPFAPPPPPSPLLRGSALTHLHSQVPAQRRVTGGGVTLFPLR